MQADRPARVTLRHLLRWKSEGRKIVALTAYDCTFARLVDEAGVDVILVGDSCANVIYGYETTVRLSLDEILPLARAVCRCVQRALVVVDMPFGTYQTSANDAVRNAVRILRETGADAVKLEGGITIAPVIEKIVQAGIPVMGHIGMQPQSVHLYGGYPLQGKTPEEVERLRKDAIAVQEAGAFSVVLEKVHADVARTITRELHIPTIGIGAGPHTDGQILVLYDMLGLNPSFRPRFLKVYADLYSTVLKAIRQYAEEVRQQVYPDSSHSYP